MNLRLWIHCVYGLSVNWVGNVVIYIILLSCPIALRLNLLMEMHQMLLEDVGMILEVVVQYFTFNLTQWTERFNFPRPVCSDISGGQEKLPIRVVNLIDDTLLPAGRSYFHLCFLDSLHEISLTVSIYVLLKHRLHCNIIMINTIICFDIVFPGA